MTTGDGIRLRVAVWPDGPAGTVVVFPGRTEVIEKYGRVAGELRSRGYSVVVIDWRGQGLSTRNPRQGMVGHVEDFRDYQRDVAAVLAEPRISGLAGPRYLLAHSMGGCIGLRTLQGPATFRAAIFSAPMWHLQMRAATREFTSRMMQLGQFMGLGARVTPGTSATPLVLEAAFAGNPLTSDPDMFAWCMEQVAAHPELALGGPSIQWTRAAFEEMARLYLAPLPNLPVLVFVGSAETVVSTAVVRNQTAKMANGTLIALPGARHEILMERPEIRATVWAEIEAFIAALDRDEECARG